MISKKKSASRIPGRFLWGLLETGETAKSFKKGFPVETPWASFGTMKQNLSWISSPEPRCHDARDQPCIGLYLSWLPKDGGWWKPSRTVHAIFWTRIILEDSTAIMWWHCNTSNLISFANWFHVKLFKIKVSSDVQIVKDEPVKTCQIPTIKLKGNHQVRIVHIQSYACIYIYIAVRLQRNRNSLSNTGFFSDIHLYSK